MSSYDASTKRRAEDELYALKKSKGKIENQLYNVKNSIKTDMGSIATCKSYKSNFEERLNDLKKIISLLENNVEDKISKFNSTSLGTDESYKGAFKSDFCIQESISKSLRAKTVTEDVNSNYTYVKCLKEKKELEIKINDLNNAISKLNANIDGLTQQARSLNGKIYSIDSEMRRLKNIIYY